MADLLESNNTLSDANLLGNNATIGLFDGKQRFTSGFIGDDLQVSASQDVDFLSVDLNRGQTVTVETVLFSLNNQFEDTYLRIFDQFGREVGSDDDAGGGLSSALDFTAQDNARYYIGVSGFANTGYDPNLRGSGSGSAFNFGYELAVQSPGFNSLEYIASYDDLINAFGTNSTAGLGHYESWGAFEGRDVSFNGLDYIASHDDLVFAFGADRDAGARHYINFGRNEGRSQDSFDAQQYIDNYGDLTQAFDDDLQTATAHYIILGALEGRTDADIFGL